MKDLKKLKTRSNLKIKVLIADSDRLLSRRLFDFLTEHSFEARMVHSGDELQNMLKTWVPQLIVIDLMLPKGNAFQLLRYLQKNDKSIFHTCSVVVTSTHTNLSNKDEAFRLGAKDFIEKPFTYTDLLQRLILHARSFNTLTHSLLHDASDEVDQKNEILQIDALLTAAVSEGSLEDKLHSLVLKTAENLGAVRCSVIRTVTAKNGVVLAANDNSNIAGLSIDLQNYPEIQVASQTQKIVAIENVDSSKALKKIKNQIQSFQLNAMVVSPVYYKNKPFGVLSVRFDNKHKHLDQHSIQYVGLIAKIISLTLSRFELQDLSKSGLISA